MDPITLFLIGGALAAGAVTAYLLRRKRRREDEDFGGGFGGGFPLPSQQSSESEDQMIDDSAAMQAMVERDRQEREHRRQMEQARKESAVEKTLNAADPLLAQEMRRKAGLYHNDMRSGAMDREVVRALADRLPQDLLDLLQIAATQQSIDFDLQTTEEKERVQYPTSDMEPEFMNPQSQLTDVLPDQLMQDSDTFYQMLASGELMVLQAYERKRKKKIMYILLDVSGSMDETMLNGMMRHVYSRGVTVNLLLKAVRGEAQYFLRIFDGEPHDLMRAMTEAEAAQVIRMILDMRTTGGGTNIYRAFETAVNDIRTRGGEFSQAEVLIISDGEDNSMNNVEQVKGLLGTDIKLHAMMIGKDNDSLKVAANSYRKFE